MKRPPEPSTRDLKAWDRLLDLAAKAAAAPRAPTGDLVKAVEATRMAVLPIPPVALSNPFIQLHRLAKTFAAETARGREHAAASLLVLVETCRASLAARDETTRRERKDIDG